MSAPASAASARTVYVRVMLAGIAFGGAAFIYKIVEFVRTLDQPEVAGFVVVPVTVYFAVAAGFACLFCWAWLKGHFAHIEEPKYRMLEQELEYERFEPANLDD